MGARQDNNEKTGRLDLPLRPDGGTWSFNCAYEHEMCDRAISVMKEGGSLCAVAAEIGVSVRTIARWRKMFPDWDEAIEMGLSLSQKWWEEKGQKNLEYIKSKEGEPGFREGVWKFTLATRFSHGTKEEEKEAVQEVVLDDDITQFHKDTI